MKSIQRNLAFGFSASLLIQLAFITPSKAQVAQHGSAPEEAFLDSTDSKTVNHKRAGYISGTVLDQTGAFSVGANVRLSSEGDISAQETQSGHNGQFLFANVAPGPFRIIVTAPGFDTLEFSAD